MIKPFNKRGMHILINHVPELMIEFMRRLDSGSNDGITLSDSILLDIYNEFVSQDTKLGKRYNQLCLNEEICEDGPIVAEIRKLVNEYGWKRFIQAVGQFAEKKVKQFLNLGLHERATPWISIKAKIDSVRKTADL